jgi:lysyl-tRNA synthetase class II
MQQRAMIIETVRAFFSAEGFLEIETPVRIPAPAPEAHIDTQESGDWFLQPSPELCMKRLLAAGYEKIFQICRCFRKGERGGRHVPEMTLLEWYAARFDYLDMMRQCEELIAYLAVRLGLGHQLSYQGHAVDLTRPWDRLSVSETLIWLTVVKRKKNFLPTVFQRSLSGLCSKASKGAEPVLRRLITLIFAGWLPHDLASSRSCLGLGSGVRP